ncbi:MAG: aldo/keto reductase [Phycisphaerae bacterium]
MNHRNLGMTGLRVSDLCLGAMNFGQPDFGVDAEQSQAVIDRYLEAGGNFIDTADTYGGGASETILGQALKGKRDQIILASKAFFPVVQSFGQPPAHINAQGATRRHLIQAMEDSLTRLKTDYLDLYQVHLWDLATPLEETLGALNDLVHQGKTRYVGLSNYSAWQIAEARQLCKQHGWEPFVTAQMQYSLICRHIEHDVIKVTQRYGMGILAWSPLGMGVLTGKYARGTNRLDGARFRTQAESESDIAWRAQFFNDRAFDIVEGLKQVASQLDTTPSALAIHWVMQRPGVSSVIIGPKNTDQLADNLSACTLEPTGEHICQLDRISDAPPRYPESMVFRSSRLND